MARVRTDLPWPERADEAQDLAAIDVEIEPFQDRLLAESDLDAADADDHLAVLGRGRDGGGRASLQYLIAAKNMAKRPSSTMTMKMAFTTEEVTWRPRDSADPSTARPFEGRDDADDKRHEGRLDEADQEGVQADGGPEAGQEDVRADVAVDPGGHAAARRGPRWRR